MQRARLASLSSCSALAALLHAGCNANAFDPYERTAPIRVHETPDNYELPNYGAQLATLQTDVRGQSLSTIFASAGPMSPVVISRAWNGSHVSEHGPQLRCHVPGECPGGSDIGATLIPFPTWAANSASPRDNCVFAPSNSLLAWSDHDPRLGGEAFVLCENASTVHFAMSESFLAARGEQGSLQFSGFGLPALHPLGVVIYGAHVLDTRSGERRAGNVYVQQDFNSARSSAPLALPLPLSDPMTHEAFADDPQASDLGRQVVGSVDPRGGVLVAISQPSRQRVLVAVYDASLPGFAIDKFRLRACIASPDASLRGFGERMVLGDVTGDGEPELFIGSDPVTGSEPGRQALYMYRGDGLPDAAADGLPCPSWGEAALPVECRDSAGFSCAGSAFGASLAVGDVDADQTGDLIVGAPHTKVGEAAEAGAVWLMPGIRASAGTGGLDFARTAVLSAGAHERAHLGAAVAALRTAARDEPVASAPGQGDIYVFMCSPLETGYGRDSLCLKK
ncbi:MAG: integrin-like protein [Myxococcaceae bacterium]|nr:integrin-like protein [Myxococcaceae bacterium]